MATHTIGGIPTSSITALKKNPMNIVNQSKEMNSAIYIK